MNQQTPSPELERPDLYLNRELSWIEFNRRVFEQAQDDRHPLLERVKFISIFETNLDEYIMIRLAGIKDQIASKKTLRSPDGRTAEEQLEAIRPPLSQLIQEVHEYWRTTLHPLLATQHIHVLDYEQLNERQRKAMQAYFGNEIFPVLTPLAVDQGHPFPHISNLSLNLAVVIADAAQSELFARIKVPSSLPRLVPVPVQSEEESAIAFVWIEQVIAANLHALFPGYNVWEAYPFRVLRDADIELQLDESLDLLEYIEQEVRDRRFGLVVDLAVNPSMPQRIRSLLLDNLEITSSDLTVIDGPLGMASVMELHSLDRPALKDMPFDPRTPAFLRKDANLFGAIREQDLLVHHPYDSFNSVVNFITAAAHDEKVLAIKQTLYRVGSNSPVVVQALLKAVENGKQVAVLVELKARFDEENNIGWARELERAGVHVVFGSFTLKTHAKVALVVRKEGEKLQRYVHLGTGNYNASTAKIYEDIGLFTCAPHIGADATNLFNSLTGYSRGTTYNSLLVAPTELRPKFMQLIEREIRLHERYGNGCLIFKFNALTDPEMIKLLYRASQAGVNIDLIIRGMCSLRPGVKGESDNIRVRSIVGRFLEHSRIYYFGNNDHPEVYLGSADLMQRNLDKRVETLFPIASPELRTTLYEKMLMIYLADTVNTHELQEDGTYQQPLVQAGQEAFDCQEWFINHSLFEDEETPDANGTAAEILFSEIDL
ncbi:MAG: polyphosphate kinase 1 [Ktedonobacteraceae bacterium]